MVLRVSVEFAFLSQLYTYIYNLLTLIGEIDETLI